MFAQNAASPHKGPWILFAEGTPDTNVGALAWLALYLEVAAVLFDDRSRQDEADAGAVVFAELERVNGLVQERLLGARAVVGEARSEPEMVAALGQRGKVA